MSGVFEPTAYCDPAEPFNEVAFAWPGNDREARHTDALYSQATVDTLRAQLEAAEASAERWKSASLALSGYAHAAEARAEAAEAECARLRAYAERYEFIRSASTPNVPELNVLALGALDRAIDAAMARTKEQQA